MAIVVDAVSDVVDGALNATLRVDEPRSESRKRRLGPEIREGLNWTCRHSLLGPLTVSTHVWFIARLAYPLAWILGVVAVPSLAGATPLFVALAMQGLAMGMENCPEQLLRQTLTPDELLGRSNATRRSGNRTLAAVGALSAGVSAWLVGDRATLIGVILIFAAAALAALLPPLRHASGEPSASGAS